MLMKNIHKLYISFLRLLQPTTLVKHKNCTDNIFADLENSRLPSSLQVKKWFKNMITK